MTLYNNPDKERWAMLCQRPQLDLEFLTGAVKNILEKVKQQGDSALKELTSKFDGIDIRNLEVTPEEVTSAMNEVPSELKTAIQQAATNIEKFHQQQRREVVKIETMPGVTCWREGVAIEKVGIYIPGGSAPLFSTVLMLGLPARLAGCKEIVLCTPPDKSGKVNNAILFAANLVGVTRIFKVGGAQAIAAMTFGTESIPKVSKIFGPGNQYVTKAKQLVSELGTAIDMPAGPSEVLVLADRYANPSFVAADLLSQAEHGEDSQVILVLYDESLVPLIDKELEKQLSQLPRKKIAEKALTHSRAISFDKEQDAIDFINEYAPEHLILNTQNADALTKKVINAGSVFIGNYTPEAAGDYASGTNHTLPTNGYAKAYAGVSLESFMKYITFQKITEEGIRNVGPVVEKMAEAELLNAHKMAVTLRLQQVK